MNISKISQGTFKIFNSKESIKSLLYGIDLGLNTIDTAENYNTEEVVSQLPRNKIFISTKVAPEHLRKKDVIKAAERSLKKLKSDIIDLYFIHWSHPDIPLEETAESFNILQEQGKIKYIGVSNFSLIELQKFMLMCKVDAVQNEYNLFDRTVENNLLPFCQKNNIIFMAYSPLDKNRNKLNKFGLTPAQTSLKWLIQKNVIPVVKSLNLKHIKENAEVLNMDYLDLSELDKEKTILHYIEPNKIKCDNKNLNQFIPNHTSIAKSLIKGIPLKPIRINKNYELLEGKVRYWAWREAFGNKPCPTLVRKQ